MGSLDLQVFAGPRTDLEEQLHAQHPTLPQLQTPPRTRYTVSRADPVPATLGGSRLIASIVTLQRTGRAFLQRRRFLQAREAAVRIQRSWRSVRAERRARHARTIQKWWRAMRCRRLAHAVRFVQHRFRFLTHCKKRKALAEKRSALEALRKKKLSLQGKLQQKRLSLSKLSLRDFQRLTRQNTLRNSGHACTIIYKDNREEPAEPIQTIQRKRKLQFLDEHVPKKLQGPPRSICKWKDQPQTTPTSFRVAPLVVTVQRLRSQNDSPSSPGTEKD